MSNLFLTCKQYIDYIPFLLLPLFLIAEHELEKHAFTTSIQLAIMIITITFFFVLVLKFKINRKIAILLSFGLWIILIYIKRKMSDLKKV